MIDKKNLMMSNAEPMPERKTTTGAPRLVVCVLASLLVLSGIARAERRIFNIADYGAKGDGKTVNTTSIHQAIQACAQAGGGTVYVPTGEFRTGTVILQSNVHLLIEAGGVLKGSDRISDYLSEGNNRFGLILARNAENIAITG